MRKGVLDRCCGRRNFAHAFVRMVCDARALGRRPNGVLFLAVVVLAGAIGVGGAFAQSLTVDKMSFGSGQTITVSGTGFAPGVAVRVWFDSNGDHSPIATLAHNFHFNEERRTNAGVVFSVAKLKTMG